MSSETPEKLTEDDEELFRYPLCSKEFAQRASLRLHKLVHRKEMPHKCEKSGKRFELKSTLKRYMLRHTEKKRFPCKVCGKVFSLQTLLDAHKLAHSSKCYKCCKCQKTFLHKNALEKHEQTCLCILKHSCKLCGKQFVRKSWLKRHKRTHLDDDEFQCGICKKCFKSEGSLESHRHSQCVDLCYKCDSCGRGFKKNADLSHHLNICQRKREFVCEACGDKFHTKSSLVNHMAVHKKQMKCPCPACSKIPSALPNEKKLGTCCLKKSYCVKCFKVINITVTQVGEIYSYICESCNQRDIHKCQSCTQVFDKKEELDAHLLASENCRMGQFVCDICGSIFTKKSALSYHKKSHEEEQEESQSSGCNKNMRKAECVKCMRNININVHKIGEQSAYLCMCCLKENNGRSTLNITQSDTYSQNLESPRNEKIRGKEVDIIENCTVGNSELWESEDNKEGIDIGETFLSYESDESQTIFTIDGIIQERDL